MSAIIFILWFFHIQQRIFYYLYFWQLKMYRIDRFWEEIQRNKKIILPQIYPFVLFFLLLFYVLGNNILVLYLLAGFYFILSYRSFSQLLKGKWKLPVLTKKMIVISGLGLIAWLLLSFYFWWNIVVFILLFELLLPLFIFFSIEVLELPASLFRRYLMIKAKRKREGFSDLLVIGITGSYGKSSTKEFLYALLSGKYGPDKVLKTVGNINTEIGIANTVLGQLKKEHKFFICEVAAYRRGEIKTSCNIIKPTMGILTGINEQHLAMFGSQKNIVEAKFELIDALPQGGTAVLNRDSIHVRNEDILSHNKGLKKVIWCSIQDNSEVSARNIKIEKDRVSFTLSIGKEKVQAVVPVLGIHNIQNILFATAIAGELGMSVQEIGERLKNLPIEANPLKVMEGKEGLNIIDSSYSANPNGVISDLEYLALWEGKRVVVMPSLIELGGASKEIHERIGKKIAEVCDLAIITTKEGFEDIKKGAGIIAEFLENPDAIAEKVRSIGGTVLLEGRIPRDIIKLLQ